RQKQANCQNYCLHWTPPFPIQNLDSLLPLHSSLLTPHSLRLTLHRITLSARYSTDCGIVRLSAFAVLRLITNSNFVGCSTGRSAGFAPFKILSTYTAARRYRSKKCVPYDMRPPASRWEERHGGK